MSFRRADVAEERDAPVAGPNEQIGQAVSIPVGHERPGVPLDVDGFTARLERLLFSKSVLFRRPLVGDQIDVPADVADDQIVVAVAVPVGGMDSRGRPGRPDGLFRRAFHPLAVIGDECPFRRLFVLGIAGNEDMVAVVARTAADVDEFARPVLDHFRRREGAVRAAAKEEQFAGP